MSRPKKKKAKPSSPLEDAAQDSAGKTYESKESFTPERRKRKKKKLPDAETSFTNQILGSVSVIQNGSGTDYQHLEEGSARKPRRRAKKLRPAEQGFPNDLGLEEEDILPDGQMKSPEPHPSFIVPSLTSQPVGKPFVERNRKFQAADRSVIRTAEHVEDFMDVKPAWSSMEVSLSVHRAFRMIGLFCSGFLAGYTVWNIVVIYLLAGTQLTTLPNLLDIYKELAYPSQCLLYLLLALSAVSAYDRTDLASVSHAFRGLVALDPAAVASFLYFVALFLALSQQMTSDRINFYTPPTQNGSLWQEGTESQILQPWIVVNLVVTLLVGIAWLFLSYRPDLDHSEDSMFIPEEEDFPDTEKGIKIQA
ncbi:transmembrane protein 237 [Pseudophryne corroboree]|uniref:transmembrane protein 237 n=1 Tax=Pseudophryne corroboree TaxID=495146 RepID=UPI003081EE71